MKLKARQIIPGWPKGRSTSSGPQSRRLEGWPLAYLSNKPPFIFLGIAQFRMWSYEDIELGAAEAREIRAYHAAQAEMLEKWLKMRCDWREMLRVAAFEQHYVQTMVDYYTRMQSPLTFGPPLKIGGESPHDKLEGK